MVTRVGCGHNRPETYRNIWGGGLQKSFSQEQQNNDLVISMCKHHKKVQIQICSRGGVGPQ